MVSASRRMPRLLGELRLGRKPRPHGQLAVVHGAGELLRDAVGETLVLNGLKAKHGKALL